jgi:hypothetical protein
MEDFDQGAEATKQPVSNEIERLRELRRGITENRTVDIEVPGYHNLLVARYRLLDWKTVRGIVKRLEGRNNQSESEMLAQMDTIASACVELLLRKDDGSLIGMDDDYGPVRYDRQLCKILELPEPATAREAIVSLFVSDMAIVGHHAKLITWMQGEQEEVDEEFLGESLGQLP